LDIIAGLLLGTSVLGLIEEPRLIEQLLSLGMMSVMLFLGFSFRPVQLWLERKEYLEIAVFNSQLSLLFSLQYAFYYSNNFLRALFLAVLSLFQQWR
jgi:glutathione-regulated potassium-efflux system protein KefB